MHDARRALNVRGLLSASLTGTATLALAAATLGGTPAAAAQVGPLVRVTVADPFTGCTADKVAQQQGQNYPNTEVEPFAAADPTNPSNVLVGHQQDRWSNGGSRGLMAQVSNNGGTGWKPVVVPRLTLCSSDTYQRASDPWVSFGPTGTAYYTSLRFNGTVNSNGVTAVSVSRSTTRGATWESPITLIRDTNRQYFDDKESVTADPTDPNLAYVVWDRLQGDLATEERQGDGGSGNEGKGKLKGSAPAAGTPELDGVAMAQARLRRVLAGGKAFPERQAGTGAAAPATLPPKGPALFSRTTDGGKTWSKAGVAYDPGVNAQTLGNQIVVEPNGTVINFFTEIRYTSGAARIGLVRSTDKGKSFEKKPRYATTIELGDVQTVTPDFPYYIVRDGADLFDVAVNPKNGTVYAVWRDVRFNGVGAIGFTQSTDGGLTWSTPIMINQTPARPNKLRQQAFLPSVEVDSNGTLIVTYYDFRNDNNTGELTDYWAASCNPGGSDCRKPQSWGGEVRLTQKSFDIFNAPEAEGLFLGDYMGLTRAGDAVVAVFGIADGFNQTSLYSRRITMGGGKATVASAQ